jgi:SAM-dependent methyltransferase
MPSPATDADREYTERLLRLQTAWWKRVLDVQAPYRWNLRRLKPGFTLEIGCGIGRNLIHLGGTGVGTDTNAQSISVCRARGLKAFTPEDFSRSEFAKPLTFDSILLSHVAEHMRLPELVALLREYSAYLKADGRLILITPQEVGYRSDATHVEFMDFGKLGSALDELGFARERAFSFPFPRWVGHLFIYNEFVVVGRQTRNIR